MMAFANNTSAKVTGKAPVCCPQHAADKTNILRAATASEGDMAEYFVGDDK
jgi:hypothetical protein